MTRTPDTPQYHFRDPILSGSNPEQKVKPINPYPLGHPLRYLYEDRPEGQSPRAPSTPVRQTPSDDRQSINNSYQHDPRPEHPTSAASPSPGALHAPSLTHHVLASPAPKSHHETFAPAHKDKILIIHLDADSSGEWGNVPRSRVLTLAPAEATFLLKLLDQYEPGNSRAQTESEY